MRAASARAYGRCMSNFVITEARLSPPSAGWLRVFALVYDPFLWLGEIAGMRRRRRELVSAARGRVLEIGAGTGLNIAHYPDGITELVLAEPEPAMRRYLARRLSRCARPARIVDAAAECLPLPDDSVDTVVSTLVLCTVDDLDAAIHEIARVLRPGGQLLFIEHVRASSRFLSACQDKLVVPWRRFAAGCVCNRPTGEVLRGRGFTVTAEHAAWRAMPPIVRPLVTGRAQICVGHSIR